MVKKNKESEEERPTFNMGLATLQRIDIAMRNANTYRLIGDYLSLKESVNSLFLEIFPFLAPNEKKQHIKNKKEIDKATLNYENYLKTKSGNKAFSKVIMTPPDKFIKLLERWELSLRVLLKEHDLLMPSAEDPRFAMMH